MHVQRAQSIGFFDFIDWTDDKNVGCLDLKVFSVLADLCLPFSGTIANVERADDVNSHKKSSYNVTLNPSPSEEPLWFTIVKIISYATIILPLIAFAIKVLVRYCGIYKFNIDDKTAKIREEGVSEKSAYSAMQPAKIQVQNLDALENMAKEAGFKQGLQGTIVHKEEVITVKTAISKVIDLLNQAPRDEENPKLIHLSKDQLGFWASDLHPYPSNSRLGKILTILEGNGAISHYMFCLPKEIYVWV